MAVIAFLELKSPKHGWCTHALREEGVTYQKDRRGRARIWGEPCRAEPKPTGCLITHLVSDGVRIKCAWSGYEDSKSVGVLSAGQMYH